MRSAQSTSLHSDARYVRLLDAQSRWPNQYVMAQTQPQQLRDRAIDGQATAHVGKEQVTTYNTLLSEHTRVKVRASQNRPQTELFGTAPYVALGRGHLHNIDASNAARFPVFTDLNMPKRILTERQLDRWDYVTYKPRVEATQRGGVLTRIGAQYVRPGL